jgi:hypothetical protein
MIKGHTFYTGESCSAGSLNALVDSATLSPTDITAWTAKTATVGADRAVIADSADSNALKSVTLANLLPAGSVTPAKLDPEGAFTGYSFRFGLTSDSNWIWMPDSSSNAAVLQQTTSAGVALTPAVIPIRVEEDATDALLVLDGAVVEVTGAVTASGNVQGEYLVSRAVVPQVQFLDTEATTYSGVVAYDGINDLLNFGTITTAGGGARKYPLRLHGNAASFSLDINSSGKVLCGYDFSVAGAATFTGAATFSDDVIVEAAASAPGSGDGGTVGTIRYYSGKFYVCVAACGTNSWKELAMSTYT